MLQEGWELCSTWRGGKDGMGWDGRAQLAQAGGFGRVCSAARSGLQSGCVSKERRGKREHRGTAKKGNVKQRTEVKRVEKK